MSIGELIAEIKASLRLQEKRDLIDEVSIYRWVEIALKKFGGDITVPKDVILDVKRKQADVPSDYYDLILAYKCEFNGYEIPEGDKIIPELQNTFAWKERTEKTYKWCSCEECCKEECEKTIIEKFYINTHDHNRHEIRCHYNKPVPLKLAKPMIKDLCISDCRNKLVKESPYEINIVGGVLYANFDGPVYFKYKALPFDNKSEIMIPDTPLGGLADYVENYVKMRLFEDWMFNGEYPGADKLYQTYLQLDQIKYKAVRTELKMANLRLDDFYKYLERSRNDLALYQILTPPVDQVFKII